MVYRYEWAGGVCTSGLRVRDAEGARKGGAQHGSEAYPAAARPRAVRPATDGRRAGARPDEIFFGFAAVDLVIGDFLRIWAQ
ncbi:hypothetical protein AT05_03935 [Schleiferia thermophila str. Yellowstone]|uniref:Uncharacterized protein n=1 Tax=Schleiferia thermophila TaxID=884107 RepID=A0A369A6E5_9FLAO|nr:hypothetical protein AT05_03935 [Schleiferia thermophila str. Yellowstone]RCX03988.1 hypothetical protein DES35_102447 [Schleiferia thermophila]GCD80221.1 hypothetical protein JCM30197_14680 [Schleiferia thermophila]